MGARHETPAPTTEEKPATAGRSFKTAQAVTANEGRGLRSALTSPPVHAGGFCNERDATEAVLEARNCSAGDLEHFDSVQMKAGLLLLVA